MPRDAPCGSRWGCSGTVGKRDGGVASGAADGAVQPPPDAQMLLDLDLLKGTDLNRERELYDAHADSGAHADPRVDAELGRPLPRQTPAPSEAKER